jgi:hypothetical protein
MKNIFANHVATVSEGRVAGAVIDDSVPVSNFARRFPGAAHIRICPY